MANLIGSNANQVPTNGMLGNLAFQDADNPSFAASLLPSQTSNSGKFVTTNGTAASWAALPATGLILLATATPSVSANIDFLSTFSGTYDNYLIVGNGITFGTDDGLSLRLAASGAADSGSNYVDLTGGSNIAQTSTSTSLPISSSATIRSAGKGCNFEIEVYGSNATTQFKGIRSNIVWNDTSGTSYIYYSKMAAYIAANAITGFRLFSTLGGNFAATGKIRVYGRVNS